MCKITRFNNGLTKSAASENGFVSSADQWSNFGHSLLLRDLIFHTDEMSNSDAMQLSNSVKSTELLMHVKGTESEKRMHTGHVVAHWTCCCSLDMLLLTGHVVAYWTCCCLLNMLLLAGHVARWTCCCSLDMLLLTGHV